MKAVPKTDFKTAYIFRKNKTGTEESEINFSSSVPVLSEQKTVLTINLYFPVNCAFAAFLPSLSV
jgi:hypothetical protein